MTDKPVREFIKELSNTKVKRKYNIGDKVKIQTTNDDGIVYYDCEIIGYERKQVYINGEHENVYKLQTINKPTFYFSKDEKELN